jgi:hypothetical protein
MRRQVQCNHCLRGGRLPRSAPWRQVSLLILLTVKAYENAPPISGNIRQSRRSRSLCSRRRHCRPAGLLEHGLMDNGAIWGHGGYLGPDFSAQSLHILALDLADRIARERLNPVTLTLRPRRGPRSRAPSPSSSRPIATIQRQGRWLCRTVRPILQWSGRILDEIFRPAREKWRARPRGGERPTRATSAERLLRLDGLGFGSYASRHFTFLYQQLHLRTAGRKYPLLLVV